MIRFEYQAPKSLEEAVSLMDREGDKASIIAGGTDLIVQMKQGQACSALIVDVKGIPELNRLEWNEAEGLHIGAAVPLSELVPFPPLVERFGMLAKACSVIGSIQVRNRATMGGNICNAAPSADTPPALLCLSAKAIVACVNGTRVIPLEDFFIGPGQTALGRNEILMEIEVPTPLKSSAGCYLRHVPRQEMDISVVGVASYLTLIPQGNILEDAKIALGAVAPTPTRAKQAETVLIGNPLSQDTICQAAERAVEAIHPISDVRGSEEYRSELVKVLTLKSLEESVKTLGIKM